MKAKIHFITGGQRSGKSAYAEETSLKLSEHPIYLATSKVWDEEHHKRIMIHRSSRNQAWQTVEEEIAIDQHDFTGKVVLLDCITLWLTNIFDQVQYDQEVALSKAKTIWDQFIQQNMTLIVVSNEIGLGIIPIEKSARQFIDLQGAMNQYIAQQAQEVSLVVSGIPVKIKHD